MVFGAPPWREIYVNDAERTQDFDEAVATYDLCVRSYRDFGYRIVELPPDTVEARADFVLSRVAP